MALPKMHLSLDFWLHYAEWFSEEVNHTVGHPDDTKGKVLMLLEEIHDANASKDQDLLWRIILVSDLIVK